MKKCSVVKEGSSGNRQQVCLLMLHCCKRLGMIEGNYILTFFTFLNTKHKAAGTTTILTACFNTASPLKSYEKPSQKIYGTKTFVLLIRQNINRKLLYIIELLS